MLKLCAVKRGENIKVQKSALFMSSTQGTGSYNIESEISTQVGRLRYFGLCVSHTGETDL